MRLVLIGCEYSGTTTLANAIRDWAVEVLGERILLHDHGKIPHISGHPPHETEATLLTEEEKRQVLEASPRVKELLMRYSLYYHTPYYPRPEGGIVVGHHVDDMVYGPLYFGYGGDGEPGDRSLVSRHIEQRLLEVAPETVLVLVKASPEAIAERMVATPHQYGVVRQEDIEHILRRFEEEYERSQIRNKIDLDTTVATVEETLAEFVQEVEPHLSQADRVRLVARRGLGADRRE
jgi:hypothetical protein